MVLWKSGANEEPVKPAEPGKHVKAQREAIARGALSGNPTTVASGSGTGYVDGHSTGSWEDRSWTRSDWTREHGCSVDHATPLLVFTGEGFRIHAGGANKTKWAKPDPRPGQVGILLDLADVWNVSPVIQAPGMEGFATPPIPKISVRWRDYGTPVVNKSEWQTIAGYVKKFGGATISCRGGHGRTGTCLAILGCVLGLIPENMDPIKFVRKAYCNKAVESTEQVKYIREITGRICADGGSK